MISLNRKINKRKKSIVREKEYSIQIYKLLQRYTLTFKKLLRKNANVVTIKLNIKIVERKS